MTLNIKIQALQYVFIVKAKQYVHIYRVYNSSIVGKKKKIKYSWHANCSSVFIWTASSLPLVSSMAADLASSSYTENQFPACSTFSLYNGHYHLHLHLQLVEFGSPISPAPPGAAPLATRLVVCSLICCGSIPRCQGFLHIRFRPLLSCHLQAPAAPPQSCIHRSFRSPSYSCSILHIK